MTELYKSLHQETSYSYLLKSNLQKYSLPNSFTFDCISFNKDTAIKFNPDILQKEVIQFIEKINIERDNPLKIKSYDRDEELFEAIKKFVNQTHQN